MGKIKVTFSEIQAAKKTGKRFLIPAILANIYSVTFAFWRWMLTIQWGNFD